MARYRIIEVKEKDGFLEITVKKTEKCEMCKTYFFHNEKIAKGYLKTITESELCELYENNNGNSVFSIGQSLLSGKYILIAEAKRKEK